MWTCTWAGPRGICVTRQPFAPFSLLSTSTKVIDWYWRSSAVTTLSDQRRLVDRWLYCSYSVIEPQPGGQGRETSVKSSFCRWRCAFENDRHGAIVAEFTSAKAANWGLSPEVTSFTDLRLRTQTYFFFFLRTKVLYAHNFFNAHKLKILLQQYPHSINSKTPVLNLKHRSFVPD